MKTADYLAAVKAKRNIVSDYKLAKALSISTQLASKYVKGQSVPGPVVAFRIAEILGDQPAAVVADLEAERAEKMGKEDELEEWRAWLQTARRARGFAGASILLAAGSGGISNANAGLAHAPTVDTAHIVSTRRKRKKAGWFDGLMPSMSLAL
jgi:hypothetical protein